MDAVEEIKPYKDSTFAMMLAAQARGHALYYFQQQDLWAEDGIAMTACQAITVSDTAGHYFALDDAISCPLHAFDAILMRKDPPFDMEYIYSTYFLDMAVAQGTLVVNPPNALRQVNEKFFITDFPELAPPTLISQDIGRIKAFISAHKQAVLKPLDGMGGKGIFKMTQGEPNTNAILEALGNGQQTLMIQAFLPEVCAGDKRILLVDGEPAAHGLARIPSDADFRANLAVGGRGEVQPLSARERAICEAIKPRLQALGLLFVGLDVIGGYVTEINVTSPTCIREIEAATGEQIADRLIAKIESMVLAG
ncbi:glutathione synthase [Cardiobacteriales bacterium ML27]|uniref:Glutathione synthetase n=2 Tax=Ostreibacterium oceani TaxID=2654998 RepID=A0A6N7EUE1_9GAMM|nr:glutathione synthase [Ostreibacterium oceani]